MMLSFKNPMTWFGFSVFALVTVGCSGEQGGGASGSSEKPGSQPNPYVRFLQSEAAKLPEINEDAALAAGGSFVERARKLNLMSWAALDMRSGLSTSDRETLRKAAIREIDALVETATGTKGPGASDPNMSRFFLSPLLNSIHRIREAQAVEPVAIDVWLKDLRPSVEYQKNEYGGNTSANWDTRLAGGYPNMDAAYVHIMGLAEVLYNNPEYGKSAEIFVEAIRENLLPGGGIRYVGDNRGEGINTNPAPVYTGVVVRFIADYVTLSDSQNARQLLQLMAPHYPRAWVFPGIPENSSAPWWKHRNYSRRFEHAGVFEILASVAESSENRAIAEQLVELGWMSRDDALVAVDFFDPGIEPGARPADGVFIDPDIDGIRGRFGDFSWVGSLGPSQDTLVGALAVTPPGDANAQRLNPRGYDFHSVLLVSPEVTAVPNRKPREPLFRHAAFVTGQAYPGTCAVVPDAEIGFLGASYSLRQPVIFKPESEPVPWQSDQVWLFLPDRLVGLVTLRATRPAVESGAWFARMRVRTEHRNNLRKAPGPRKFKNGPIAIDILETTFPHVRDGLAAVTAHRENPPADEIFLEDKRGSVSREHFAFIEIRHEASAAVSEYQNLTENENIMSFTVSASGVQYQLWFNRTGDTQKIPMLDAGRYYRAFTKAGKAENAEIVDGTMSVPPYGTACQILR
jgi:hypothetical protein